MAERQVEANVDALEFSRLVQQRLLAVDALRNVLMRGNPSTVWERSAFDRDDPAVAELVDLVSLRGMEADRVSDVQLFRAGCPEAEQILRGRSRLDLVVSGAVHVLERLVRNDELPVRVEHAKPLGHVRQRGVESQVDARKLGGLVEKRFLVADALGDVLVDGDPSAAGDRRIRDRDRSSVLQACDVRTLAVFSKLFPEFA